jgi:hypothetical protein
VAKRVTKMTKEAPKVAMRQGGGRIRLTLAAGHLEERLMFTTTGSTWGEMGESKKGRHPRGRGGFVVIWARFFLNKYFCV